MFAPVDSSSKHVSVARIAVLLLAITSTACLERWDADAVDPETEVADTALVLVGSLKAINGTYGAGCHQREGSWSVWMSGGDPLAYPALSVIKANTACALALTSIVTDQTYSVPSLSLTAAYQTTAAAVLSAGAVVFYVNAKLDATTFASNFLFTLLVSTDPSMASNDLAARYTYPTEVVRDAPISYWRLGEISGTTAVDVMGTSSGTYAGSYTLGAAGALIHSSDTGVDLDGASGSVSIPSVPAYELTGGFSIEAWIRPDALTSTRWIVNKATSYYLYLSDGHVIFGFSSIAGDQYVVSPLTVTPGDWQHLVGTYDGASVKLYRNGVLVTQLSTTDAVTTGTDPVYIGALSPEESFFDGTVDEVALYGFALSDTRVAAHHDRGVLP